MAATEPSPQPTLGEEIANAVSHGIAFLLAVASLPILVHFAARDGGPANVVGASLFAATMILLYLVSAIYHALPPGRAKLWLQRLDHAAIFLFIAGSYMPFALGVLRGAWGWTLLGIVWALAAIGVAAKILHRLRHPGWSTALYLVMGWLVVVAAVPLSTRLEPAGLAWLVGGGVAYTLGAAIFLLDRRLRYAHFVWHLLVMAGSTCHFFAALWHAV